MVLGSVAVLVLEALPIYRRGCLVRLVLGRVRHAVLVCVCVCVCVPSIVRMVLGSVPAAMI